MSADTFQVYPERVTEQPWEREELKTRSPAWPQLCLSPLFLMCKTAVTSNNRFFCILLASIYRGKTCHSPYHVLLSLLGDAKHLKLTSSKSHQHCHIQGERHLCKNDLCCFKDHEKSERTEKCFSPSKFRKHWQSSSALVSPLSLPSFCTLHFWGGSGGGGTCLLST